MWSPQLVDAETLAATRRTLVALLSLVALAGLGCPDSPDYSPEMPATKDAAVYLSVRAPETVVMVAGDRLVVEVDTTTNNHHGKTLPEHVDYQVAIAARYAAHAGVPDVAEFAFDYGAGTAARPRLAALAIDTRAETEPGIYEYEIDTDWEGAGFRVNPPAVLHLVVLPTGGAIQTAGVSRIAAGQEHTLALLEDGTVWAWGDNDEGQLGDGTLIDRSVPVLVTGFDGPIRAIAAGRKHSVALGENGRVYTWGLNDRKQLGVAWTWRDRARCPGGGHPDGDPREGTFSSPRFLITGLSATGCEYVTPIVESAVEIAAGDDHTLVRLSDRSVVSFGANEHGQLGDELANDGRDFVKQVQGLFGQPSALAAGGDTSFVLHVEGVVEGWGDNGSLQIGQNPATDTLLAIDVPFTGDLQLLSAGERFVLARRRGEPGFVAWGSNSFGQLGNGTTEGDGFPRHLATHLQISQLAAGDRHSLAVLFGGGVYAWGDNSTEQLGGATTDFRVLAPVPVPGLTDMSGIAAGGFHSLARHGRCHTLWSWGRNVSGQLGQVDRSLSQATPLPVYGLGEGDLGIGCDLALRVWQHGEGAVSTGDADFGEVGCDGEYCAVALPGGSVVTLTATPDEGWEFVEWKGDCSGVSPIVSLTLDQSASCIARYRSIAGFDAPPSAGFRVTPSSPEAGRSVAFDASDSSDDQGIVRYDWDFEDDGVYDATGPEVQHVFASAGAYTVRLRVSDVAGQSDERTRSVDVSAASGAGDFTLTVQLFGDGNGRVYRDGGALDCTATCSVPVSAGESIVLLPEAGAGFFFSHWGFDPPPPSTSDCDEDLGSQGCRVDITGDRTVRAIFE